MTPLKPVAPCIRVLLGVSFFVIVVAGWAAITLTGFVPKIFLADQITMVKSGWILLTQIG